jgi:hypothetical protein
VRSLLSRLEAVHVCQWLDRVRLARRVRRLQAEQDALRAALAEARVLERVWRMSAEHHHEVGDQTGELRE